MRYTRFRDRRPIVPTDGANLYYIGPQMFRAFISGDVTDSADARRLALGPYRHGAARPGCDVISAAETWPDQGVYRTARRNWSLFRPLNLGTAGDSTSGLPCRRIFYRRLIGL